ncbi:LuxR C-terminal-related transcriptional regulator [Aldersonia sp. NBC_00410]|uniref:LuxR C-terminal-related transcriptional regulator n=1 Tax=Aldersonia sp. NBC_00410 TaxID=2975954 RepID=UPI002257290F|nr:LuxR C-terminal-related transcriptional regulator [Aldersonia sp. NBC_00410]MCX5046526.1 LuxR C-terminal-related transcriptional regulator [Aldersonia sp. NBC_00410]
MSTSGTDLLRPRDGDALRAELRRLAGAGAAPILFGGEVHASDMLLLSEFFGTRTSGLRGLLVAPDSGLGGTAVTSRRPFAVSDYAGARSITHHYDGPVNGEGIRAVLAVPVVVGGAPRAVLYAADRAAGPIGDRAADQMMQAGRRLATEITIRDEVDRRLRMRTAHETRGGALPGTEQLRAIHTELRALAADLPETERARLQKLTARLAAVASGETASTDSADATLSPREIDVLAQVALGATNAEAATRLSVRAETVKSYLRSAMSKLGAHSRHEAVVLARRAGLLP